MNSRILEVDGLLNARDLGGLPLRRGGVTPTGVFYRSALADRITPSGWEQLRAAGIRSIVDLRAPGERARDVQGRPEWLTTVVVDLDGPENREFWPYYEDSGLDGTPLVFLPHLAAMPERMGWVLGGAFAVTANADHKVVLIEELLREYGTTTERAFLEALQGLNLSDLLHRADLTPEDRTALETWRGHLMPSDPR